MNVLVALFALVPNGEDLVIDGLRLAGREPDRVGLIIVAGNVVTEQRVILHQLDFQPGQILRYRKLREAEINLMRLGIFDTAEPPRVEVIPNGSDNQYKQILVWVKETRAGTVSVYDGPNVGSDHPLTGSVVPKK